MRLRNFFELIGAAISGWSSDNALRLSASLAYYSIFSLAPLLVIIISITGLIYGPQAASGQIAAQLTQLAGDRAADAIQALLGGASRHNAGLSATFFGLALLLFGASGVFSELKDALNTIWGVTVRPGRLLRTMIRERLISFCMVVAIGFLLLISLLLSAALTALATYTSSFFAWHAALLQWSDFALSFLMVTLLFAMIFKTLPNVEIRWRDVAVGAAVTGFLFTVGKFLIGFYLGTSGIASYYGAAGSAMVLLLWVYYSACIFFFGAEFTKAYVRKYGSGILPDKRAILRAAAPAAEPFSNRPESPRNP